MEGSTPYAHHPAVPHAPGAYVPALQMDRSAFQVPPMPAAPAPSRRSTGFWVAVAVGATAVAVVLLLGGFFLGRGSRLSDAAVQDKITQQAQTDQIAQTQALAQQRTELLRQRAAAVRRASDRARARGLRQGRSEGRQTGYRQGQNDGYAQGQNEGYTRGQNDGYTEGVDQGTCLVNYLYC